MSCSKPDGLAMVIHRQSRVLHQATMITAPPRMDAPVQCGSTIVPTVSKDANQFEVLSDNNLYSWVMRGIVI